MSFSIKDLELVCEDVQLSDIAAAYGTPTFVYSAAHITARYTDLEDNLTRFTDLPATVCYAIKANSNQAILTLLASLGAGADVVSIGEYRRALRAGFAPKKIVFAGVGKTRAEMAEALKSGVLQFNVESVTELQTLNQVAGEMGKIAPIALRLNPNVDAKTHAKITTGLAENKFGIPLLEAMDLANHMSAYPHARLDSLAVHIGSQLTDLEPYAKAYEILADTVRAFQSAGHKILRIDLGGGLGVTYATETEIKLRAYAELVQKTFGPIGLPIVLEPGRYLVASAGGLLSRTIYVKEGQEKRFIIADAAMNDLIRPTLYDAHHGIQIPHGQMHTLPTDVVGPVCETGDILAVGRQLPVVEAGDLILIEGAGAYGAVMGSTYNTRPLPAEVLVRGDRFDLIRARQNIDSLIDLDLVPDGLSSIEIPGKAT